MRSIIILIVLLQCSLQSFSGSNKLYIATSKESYLPAESVQFEIFLLNNSGIFTAVYVELLDCKGNNVAKKMLPFYSNTCWGHVDIPENDDAEFYVLYCYALNGDSTQSECFKKIFINRNDPESKIESGKEFVLDYFLEGGSFVADVPNTLLIRTADKDGNAVSTAGKIIDASSAVLGKFFTNEMGLAKLIINPDLSGKYFIVAGSKKGVEVRAGLPAAAEYGVSIAVTKNNDSLTYYVFSYAEDDKQIDYKLEIVSDNEIVYKSAINFKAGVSFVQENLISKTLPAGFLTFRITDKNNRFYAKRIFYNNYDSDDISILEIVDTISKKTVKVNVPSYVNGHGYLNIRFDDRSGIKTTGEGMKTSVDGIGSAEEITFNDFLITCSEIPLRNFTKSNTDSLLTLSGIAYSSENKILQYKKLNLVFQYGNLKKDYLPATTDYYGKFEIKGLKFYDTVAVYYQLADKSDEKNDIHVDFKVTPDRSFTPKDILWNDFACAVKKEKIESVSRKNDQNITIKSLNKNEKTLREVTVKTEKIKEMTASEKYAAEYISTANNQSNFLREGFDFIANPQTVDNIPILSFLKGRLAALEILVRSNGNIFISDHGNGIGVYLDDVDVTEQLELIANLTVSEIALVRYYSLPLRPRSNRTKTKYDEPRKNSINIDNDAGGDLMIYTKKGFRTPIQNVKGLVKTEIAGYDSDNTVIPDDSPLSYWIANWRKQKEQTIYIGLPADNIQKEAQLIIEGINPSMELYTFTKNLVFN